MMVEILDTKEGDSIYDPACGAGGMPLGAIEHVARNGGDQRTFFGKICGQEKNLFTSSIARMNLVLHGIESGKAAPSGMFLLPGRRCSQPGFFHCGLFKSPTMLLSDSRYDSFHSAV
jgi:type I restriction enzyme M protein